MKKISFNEKCHRLLREIPIGRVTTYKAIAHALKTKAYRAVGSAMHKNPDAPQVPCHRVVCSNGKICGYARGVKKKIELLRKEGIQINNGKIDLEEYSFRL